MRRDGGVEAKRELWVTQGNTGAEGWRRDHLLGEKGLPCLGSVGCCFCKELGAAGRGRGDLSVLAAHSGAEQRLQGHGALG